MSVGVLPEPLAAGSADELEGGLMVLRCHGARSSGGRSVAGRIARTFHYVCVPCRTEILVFKVHDGRVRLAPCSRCGSRYHGPTMEELGRIR